ncbi:MAG: hypothetical protein ACOH18_00915 [Candidatus Saccharimonadaceae bacterium]
MVAQQDDQPKTTNKSGRLNALAGVIAFGTMGFIAMVVWLSASGYDLTTKAHIVIGVCVTFILAIVALLCSIAGWKRALVTVTILAVIFASAMWGLRILTHTLLY